MTHCSTFLTLHQHRGCFRREAFQPYHLDPHLSLWVLTGNLAARALWNPSCGKATICTHPILMTIQSWPRSSESGVTFIAQTLSDLSSFGSKNDCLVGTWIKLRGVCTRFSPLRIPCELMYVQHSNLSASELYDAVRGIPSLRSTHISVDFQSSSSQITIRPVNMLSKIFSLGWFPKLILCLTLIYPLLWLVRYAVLGAEFGVVRVAYPLVYWVKGVDQGVPYERKGYTDREWLDANLQKIREACMAGRLGSL